MSIKGLLSEQRLSLIFGIITGDYIQKIREFLYENNQKYNFSAFSIQSVWLYILYAANDDGDYTFFKVDCARALSTSPNLVNDSFRILENLNYITNRGKGPYGCYTYRIEYPNV